MPTTYIMDKDGKTVDASTVTKPSDRHFRGAWTFNGKVISEDMTVAKKIFQDKIREVRQPLLEAEDVVYMKALEADDASAKTASVAKKKALRDAPAAKAISDADTIAKLKAAWDTSVLGDSPYAYGVSYGFDYIRSGCVSCRNNIANTKNSCYNTIFCIFRK